MKHPMRGHVGSAVEGFHVKHPNRLSGESISELRKVLDEIDVVVSGEILEKLASHLFAVVAANDRVRLTAVTVPTEGFRLHIADSLTVLPELSTTRGACVDLGSGGGFPGIPLSLVTGRGFLLLESVRKKAEFLARVVSELKAVGQIEVAALRAEELAQARPGEFGAVTVRAVAELSALVELAAPLLCEEGVLISMKGAPSSFEIERGDRVAALVGMRRKSVRELELPGKRESRSIVVYEKSGEALRDLPRRPGMAQKKPLV
ncbi:MAG: 16S rRNA (guanine(527)-N(7))-methyltransferase RsmG [Actinomycetota bacterium]|nr:16S rRNA (guanine(527)-N(7))-methyltransferase RsmG [Actinomycetota bacterium]